MEWYLVWNLEARGDSIKHSKVYSTAKQMPFARLTGPLEATTVAVTAGRSPRVPGYINTMFTPLLMPLRMRCDRHWVYRTRSSAQSRCRGTDLSGETVHRCSAKLKVNLPPCRPKGASLPSAIVSLILTGHKTNLGLSEAYIPPGQVIGFHRVSRATSYQCTNLLMYRLRLGYLQPAACSCEPKIALTATHLASRLLAGRSHYLDRSGEEAKDAPRAP